MLGIYCRTSREVEAGNSTIIQQRTAGIKFAEENNFEYELYEDEGKSGFKISDDDQDPFNNRPEFTNLINDIKTKKIDKVWVIEHSRLSRNQYASAFIFNVFEKFNITLYENKKQLDLNDPQLKFTRQILDAVSEYERQLIVGRTTRGLHKSINEGRRTHQKLYGYKKTGIDDKGYAIHTPVESEIENYKYILKRFIEGASLLKICVEIYDMNKLDRATMTHYTSTIGRVLRGYQYTGYQLTIEGYQIFKKFRKNEINNIQILLDRKYWIKSIPYPLELISIEDWVSIVERLQVHSRKFKTATKERILKASREIGTGIFKCGFCDCRYYYRDQRTKRKTSDKVYVYPTYYHTNVFVKTICKQSPKTIHSEYINEIFKIFFFYSYLVFDNTNDLIKESQRNIKHTQLKLKEKIIHIEKDILKIQKQQSKFQSVLLTTDEADIIKVLAKNISSYDDKLNDLNIELSKLKIENEKQNEKFNQTLLEMTYYDVKEKITNWFTKMNIEEQRNELIKTIKNCALYNYYMIIDTGKTVFLFDIKRHNTFDMTLLDNLNKDEVYKSHFIEMKNKKLARKFNDRLIVNVSLDLNSEMRLRVFQYLIQKFNIVYDLNEAKNLVSFVPLTGLYGFDLIPTED